MKRIGILGYGSVGKKLAKVLYPIAMVVLPKLPQRLMH